MLEHQPLLPFKSHPPIAAPAPTARSKVASAAPVLLNQILRPRTMPTKRAVPIT